MAPAILDETSFDRYLSEHDMVVIGFVEKQSDAAALSALANELPGRHPGVAIAQVSGDNRALFDMFGLSGTSTAIFRRRVGMYLEPGLPAAERSARESLAVHRVCPATRRGKPG
jgi:hypothetical protein